MFTNKIIALFLVTFSIPFSLIANGSASQLIQEVIEANGGKERLRALKDVSYQYTFRSQEKGIEDVSIERYIFDGEISFAQYTKREYFVVPEQKGYS